MTKLSPTKSIPASELTVGMLVAGPMPLEIIQLLNLKDFKTGIVYTDVIVSGGVFWRSVKSDDLVEVMLATDDF